ncbi:MAG TPA: hypothetical protein VMG13_13110 [Trebonia sp.]|nr:hypothetical protein [Trebonia sp.]
MTALAAWLALMCASSRITLARTCASRRMSSWRLRASTAILRLYSCASAT